MSEETKKPVEADEILQRVIEREKKAKQEEEKKAFIDSELLPEKFGPAQETAKYLKEKGLFDEIFQRSPELELFATGPYKDAVKLRDGVLKRGAEIIALKEKEEETARILAESEKAKTQNQSQQQSFDSPARPIGQQPTGEPTQIYATDKDFVKKLEEAGANKGLIDLAVLTGRDY